MHIRGNVEIINAERMNVRHFLFFKSSYEFVQASF